MGVLQEARLEAIATIGRLAPEHARADRAGRRRHLRRRDRRGPHARPADRAHARLRGVQLAPDPGQPRPAPAGRAVGPRAAPRPAGQRPWCISSRRRPRSPTARPGCCRRRLRRRRALADPTAWMDQAADARGGAPDRPRPRLDQRLRLGRPQPAQPDRSGPARSARASPIWRSATGTAPSASGRAAGTRARPRSTTSASRSGGHALLVDMPAPGAPPAVTPLATGRFDWRARSRADPRRGRRRGVDERLRGAAPGSGVPAAGSRASKARSRSPGASAWRAALDDLARARCASCGSTTGGSISARRPRISRRSRTAASCASRPERLRAMADDPDEPAREVAARALLRLYAEHRKLSAP